MAVGEMSWLTRRYNYGLLAVALALAAPLARAQAPQQNGSSKRATTARFTDAVITVDGRLDEAAWETAEVTAGFTQREPEEGKPSTQLTEVRVLYNHDTLYIAANCHDDAPQGIIINEIRRDFGLDQQDYFGMILDTFDDDRNGYHLTVTPIGGQRDVQFSNGGREQTISWDGVWYAEGQRGEDGYTIEVAIPFRTLRFSRAPVQVWGVQFFRSIRRNNEFAYWTEIPRRYTAMQSVSLAGELRGIENVEPGRNLQVKPYGLLGVRKLAGQDHDGDYDGGFDMKYGLTSSLTLDLTVNTDFSHVEADSQPVNLTRFPTFFQEKRDFFLENAGIFRFGDLGSNEALLFHSRTIGLERGQPIPILGGARVTGRVGGTYLGLLNMQTRSEERTPATNFTVARVRRDILSNSDVGVMFLNRQSRMDDDYNRSFGVDANLQFFARALRISGAAAKTTTPALDGDDDLLHIEGEYESNLVRFLSSTLDLGENFNPEMGFVRDVDRRIVHHEFELKPRFSPDHRIGALIRDINLRTNHEHTLLHTGGTESKVLRPELTFFFREGSTFAVQYQQNFERFEEDFDLPNDVVLPPGDYRFNRTNLIFTSDQSKPIWGTAAIRWGEFYSGKRTEKEVEFAFRPNYRLSTSLSYTRNDADLPQGFFTTHEVAIRADYTFTPKMFLNSFIQYNNEDDRLNSNIRFRLIHRPLSDIYVVYNDVRNRRDGTADWGLTLKYTHLLNF
jgi:hypothetical protein